MGTKASKNKFDREVQSRINGVLVRPPPAAILAPHPLALPSHTQVRLPVLCEPAREKELAAMNTDQLLPIAFDGNWPTMKRAFASASTLTELHAILGADEEFYEWARHTSEDPFALFGEVQSNVYRGYFRHHEGVVCTSTRALDEHLQRLPSPDHKELTQLCLPARALFVCFGMGEWAFLWSQVAANRRVIDGAYVFASATTSPTCVSVGLTTRGTSFVNYSMIELPPMELREDSAGEVRIEIDAPNADELYEDAWVNLAIDHVLKILLHLPRAKTKIAVAGLGRGEAGSSIRPEDRQYAWMIVDKAR